MEYRFKVSCSKNRLGDIRQFIKKVLEKHKVSDLEKNTIVLAVDEVCANLIIHSHNCNPTEQLELRVNIINKNVTFDIIDKGVGFNIENYKEPSIVDIVRQKKKGGIGLMLVRRIMDDIEFIEGDKMNVYRLHKRLLSK